MYDYSPGSLYFQKEKYFDYRDKLHTITAKTLILAGSDDWVCLANESVHLSQHIPDNKLHIFQGAGPSFNASVNAEASKLMREHLII